MSFFVIGSPVLLSANAAILLATEQDASFHAQFDVGRLGVSRFGTGRF